MHSFIIIKPQIGTLDISKNKETHNSQSDRQ